MTSPVIDLDNASKLQRALLVPEDIYDRPEDVVQDDDLTMSQKIDVLQIWRSNEQALLRASGEGMAGGERPQLQAVMRQLDELGA